MPRVADKLNSQAHTAAVVNGPKKSVRTMYVGLMLALASIVGVFASDSLLLFFLPSILIYFMWGMNSRIKELEKRLAGQSPGEKQSQG
jgi:NADH:ubiquinone oxidoreductase subunit 4 (subunit M)